jgi:hypothetical protein
VVVEDFALLAADCLRALLLTTCFVLARRAAFFLSVSAFRLRGVAVLAFAVEPVFLVLPFVIFFLASIIRLRDRVVFFF